MNRRSLVVFAISLTPLVCGCSGAADDEDASPWGGTIDTLPNGALRVMNPPDGLWAAREAWQLVEELRIGAIDAEGPYQFGDIAQVTFGPQGEILVLEYQAQEIRTFDARGTHVRTIGGKGGGPGELGRAIGLSRDDEHNLWVTDVGNARYSVFDSSGAYLGSHRRGLPGMVFPWMGGFGTDGRLYDVTGREAPDGSYQFVYYALDDSAAIVDSLPELAYQRSQAARIPGSASLLAPRLTFRFDPRGRIWFGVTDEYLLYQRNFRGDTVRVVSRPFDRAPISEAEKDSMLAEAAGYGPLSFERSQLPRVKPVFQRLLLDDDGRLWVQRSASDAQAPTIFDLIAADGRFLGEVRSPIALEWITPPEVRADRVLGVTRDALGVPYVVRLRIERAAGAPR